LLDKNEFVSRRLFMKEIHSIIVPIDFSEHTDPLVEYAKYIGRKFEARLKFVHVLEIPYTWGDSDYPSLAMFTTEIDEHSKKGMKQFVDRQEKDYPGCEGKILRGNNIADTIVAHVEQEGADLIIISTHGRKGLQKLWLGSVAERVIKQASCPTLTYNPYR
jgi:nucleotide-binding universal stress UspA family protein